MSSIDERVVDMKFNNAQFQSGVNSTLASLNKLKAGLKLDGATSGLDNLSKSASRFSLRGITDGISGVASKFGALGVAGVTALATITSKAVDAGLSLVKSLTIDPISAGLESYNEQINATQVILANTKAAGVGLKEVTGVLAELQQYANLTVYSFSDMTTNIGRFTAAGVPLKQATAAIKGMANVAALSGASTQQMSSAMYQMSQALSTGVIKLQDWNSLSNANMAGKGIQEALKETARTMGDNGKAMDAAIKKQGSFRNSLTEGWLTTDIFSKAMKVMGGTIDQSTGKMRAFSVEELKGMGYSTKQAKSLHQLSQSALDAATKIRTIPQLLQALKEEVAGAYGNVFKTIFGNINQATNLFSSFHTFAENALTTPINDLNVLLQGWAKLGGRAKAIDAIKNAFKALQTVVKPIKQAFTDIFPAVTAKTLYNMTVAIDNFMKKLSLSDKTAYDVWRTFRGLFAIFNIGWQVVKQLARVFGDLIGSITGNAGGLLEITGNIGDWLVSLNNSVAKGKGLTKFFNDLEKVVSSVASALSGVFKNLDFSGFSKIGSALAGLSPLAAIGAHISVVWADVVKVFHQVASFLAPEIKAIGDELGNLATQIKNAFSTGDYSGILDALNTGVLVGIVLAVRKFFKGGFQKALEELNPGAGMVSTIKETFSTLTDTMKTMQTQIQAKTLLTIAAAIAILVGSLALLSTINSKKLTTALGGMAGAFGELMGSMALLTQISKSAGFIKIPLIASSLILLSTAVLILSSAVAVLSKLNWNQLVKGLTGVGAILAMVVLTSKGLDKSSGSILRAGLAMIPFAAGVKILASAIKDMGGLSWSQIAKGLSTLTGALIAIAGAMNLMPKGMALKATGILILSAAMKVLASALSSMGGMTWMQIAKGLTTLAGALVIIGGALQLMPATLPGAAALVVAAAAFRVLAPAIQAFAGLSWSEIAKAMTVLAGSMIILAGGLTAMDGSLPGSAALVVAAAAFRVLAPALQLFGNMSWEQIAKGLVTIAGAMLILAGGLALMQGSLPGAAALIVTAGALKVLAGVLQVLGGMSWGSIAKGLVAIAAAFAIIGVAGLVLTPVIPSILALAAAIALLGAGAALLGAGALAIATAFGVIAAAGTAGIAVLTGMINLIPLFMQKFAEGIAAFAITITQQAGTFTAAFVALLSSLLTAINNIAPQIAHTFGVILTLALGIIVKYTPMIAKAGVNLIDALLKAINSKIGSITQSAISIVVTFLNTVSKNMGKITAAGINLIAQFIKGVANNVGKIITPAASLIVKFINGISNNLGKIVNAGGNLAVKFINGISNQITKIANAATNLIVRFLNTISSNMGRIATAGTNLVIHFINAVANSSTKIVGAAVTAIVRFVSAVGANLGRVAQAGADLAVRFVNSVADAIRNNSGAMGAAGANLGEAVAQGMASGIAGGIGWVISAAQNLAQSAVATAKHALGIHSPSKEFAKLGAYSAQGFAKGLKGGKPDIDKAYNTMKSTLSDAMKSSAKDVVTLEAKLKSMTKSRKGDAKAIRQTRLELAQAQKEHKAESNAYTELIKHQNDDRIHLDNLSKAHDNLTAKIANEKKVLADATKTRDDYYKSVRDQYMAAPTIDATTSVVSFTAELKNQIRDTKAFATQIQKLRKMGLNDSLYEQLLSAGTDALPFVNQLVTQGKAGVKSLDGLSSQLSNASKSLASTASRNLYQAAVNSAAGLVKGLENQQAAIQKQMNKIADGMVNAIKKKLKIHSPSQVFEEIGRYANQGLANGLDKFSDVVSNSSENVGDTAIVSMQKALSKISDSVATNMESNPSIKPVLDLTEVKKGASQIGGLLDQNKIDVGSVYMKAKALDPTAQDSSSSTKTPTTTPPPVLNYTQNNYSPKAINPTDLYRQTKNQISTVKGALQKTNAGSTGSSK